MPDKGKISDIVLHPVRLRVLQAVGGRRLTTAQLRSELPDVSQATLYRHIGALVTAGFLQVVDERRVRGSVERTYALGDRLAHVEQAELDSMSEEQLRAAFLSFLQQLGSTLEKAVEESGPALRNHLGFGLTAIHVDQSDLETIQRELAELIGRYLTEAEGKQRVILSTALLPQ